MSHIPVTADVTLRLRVFLELLHVFMFQLEDPILVYDSPPATIWENSSGQTHIIKAEKSQKFKSQEMRHFQHKNNNTAFAFWRCERKNLVE